MRKSIHTLNIRMKRIRGYSVRRAWIKQTILAALEAEKVFAPMEIDCLITDDAGIQVLNRRYRGINTPTDVLSFALDEPGQEGAAFPRTPGSTSGMGIVVVSYPTALAQAELNGIPVEDEMSLLLVHGLLHLLGYDHSGKSDGLVMRRKEREILGLLKRRGIKT